MIKVCKLCGKEFELRSNHAHQRQFCYDKHYHKCDYCGKEFELSVAKCQQIIKNPKRRFFCSLSCASRYGNSTRDINKVIQKMNDTCIKKYGVIGYNNRKKFKQTEATQDIWLKSHLTKKKNGSYGKSKIEDKVYKHLISKYSVVRQVIINGMNFDFKVNNVLIEINGMFYHNYEPFKNTQNHIKEYNVLCSKGGVYRTVANTWRYRDVDKLQYCKNNNIPLLVVYCDNQIDKYFDVIDSMIDTLMKQQKRCKNIKII